MERGALLDLMAKVREGAVTPEAAVQELGALSTKDLGFARVDAQRALRVGLPEVVYGEGKTAAECAAIAAELDRLGHPVLVTRLDATKAGAVLEAVPEGRYYERARLFARTRGVDPHPIKGPVAVLCAGTSDLPFAEEAAVTVETIGQPVERLYDVGVAGLHRLLEKLDVLRRAGVVIVVAGMEGALPSVVGGLVGVPVIAVPAPVGYGASAGGYSALLGMLSSCSPNVAVVNIGNGFGAGYVAALANRTGGAVRS
jgi:NCAIR mutase (PurE)-related protein